MSRVFSNLVKLSRRSAGGTADTAMIAASAVMAATTGTAARSVIAATAMMTATAVFATGCADSNETATLDDSNGMATLVVRDARVWTGRADLPWAEAVAISDDRILAVGSNSEMETLTDDETRIIEGTGRLVTPGFIDSHVHFISGGFNLSSVQLRDAPSPQVFIDRIAEFARDLEPGVWILGGDWDHEQWGGALPRRDWIDSVTTDNPVWVNRLDGHMALANTAALTAAGVTKDTEEVDGGTIERYDDGEPAGILKDNAMYLVDRVIPDAPDALKDRALDEAMAYVAAQGITSVHDMGSWGNVAVFERARNEGRMKTRIYAAVPLWDWQRLKARIDSTGRGDEWVRLGGLKGFVDGSLGSHTAAFMEPFTDAPDDTGLLISTEEDLYAWTSGADKAGLHVMVHAIGDRAIGMQLDIFERIAAENGPRDRRFRIEHAQHIAPEDMARFSSQGVIPSMQPYHAIDDGRWAEKVIGPERIKTTYAFRSLLDTGARLALGSDWSVAPATPVEGIYAAVTRRTLDGLNPDGWVPEQKITVEEALRGYTIDAAYAAYEEDVKGSLEPGKLADFVILDRDLTTMPPEEIRDAKVDLTVVGGNIVYER